MKSIFEFLVFIFFIASFQLSEGSERPWNLPDIYQYNNDSFILNIKNRNDYKSLDDHPWFIHADKKAVKLFDDSNGNKLKGKRTFFLEQFYIYDKKGKFIFVKNKEKEGWAKFEDFILLPMARKNKYSIYKKAILVNNADKFDTTAQEEIIYAYDSPMKNGTPCYKINFLEFGFIYKSYRLKNEKASFVLLGTAPTFEFYDETHPKKQQVNINILGWINTKHLQLWSTRAFQSNENKKHPFCYFKNKKDFVSYYYEPPLLFQKIELQRLFAVLSLICERQQKYFNDKDFKSIWITFLESTIGVTDYQKNEKLLDIIKKQYGFNLRSQQELLSISYNDVDLFLHKYTPEKRRTLKLEFIKYFNEMYNFLSDILKDENKHLFFGEGFIWIDSSKFIH